MRKIVGLVAAACLFLAVGALYQADARRTSGNVASNPLEAKAWNGTVGGLPASGELISLISTLPSDRRVHDLEVCNRDSSVAVVVNTTSTALGSIDYDYSDGEGDPMVKPDTCRSFSSVLTAGNIEVASTGASVIVSVTWSR